MKVLSLTLCQLHTCFLVNEGILAHFVSTSFLPLLWPDRLTLFLFFCFKSGLYLHLLYFIWVLGFPFYNFICWTQCQVTNVENKMFLFLRVNHVCHHLHSYRRAGMLSLFRKSWLKGELLVRVVFAIWFVALTIINLLYMYNYCMRDTMCCLYTTVYANKRWVSLLIDILVWKVFRLIT